MADLIDRQGAIDALEREKTYCTAFRDGYTPINVFEKYNDGLTDGIKALKNMPSAQPEIIRCKDCKYWMPHSQLGYDEDNEMYHDYCEKLIPEDEYYAFYRDADDFCSYGEEKSDGRPD